MKKNILDLIDFEKVDTLLEGFNKSTGFVTAILDLNGNVLSKSGWRKICTDFHRVNPETSSKCTISDTLLANKLAQGEKYHFYKCLNGLVDVAVPIVINEEHIANLFSGQFFFEQPNRKFFKKQAENYGFDEEKYLKALENIPVVSKEKVKITMDFLLNMTEIIAEMTQKKLEQEELSDALRENEEKYRLLHEAAGVGIGYYTPNGIVISYNSLAAKNMNGKPEDFVGKSIFEIFPKTEAAFYLDRIKKATLSKSPQSYEDKVDLPDRVVWFNSIFTRIVDSKNGIAGIQIISTDITNRKLAEEKQKSLSDRFNRIAANVPGAIYEFCMKPDGTFYIPYVSEGFSEIYGLAPEEVKTDSTPLLRLIHPEDSEGFYNSIKESAEKLTQWNNENRVILPSGEIIWIEGKSTPQKLADGTIMWHGYINNITNRKKAEELIRLERFNLKSVLENMQSGVFFFDEKGENCWMNPEALRIHGFSSSLDMLERFSQYAQEWELSDPSGRVLSLEEWPGSRAFRGERYQNYEVRLRELKSGKTTEVLYSCADVRDIYGNIERLVFTILDITDRKQAQIALKESEYKYRLLADNSGDVIFTLDMDLNFTYLSPAVKILRGLEPEEAIKQNLNEVLTPASYQKAIKVLSEILTENLNRTEDPILQKTLELEMYRMDNTAIWTEVKASLILDKNNNTIGILGVTRDISERKNIEIELIKSQNRFQSITEVAGDWIWEVDANGMYTYSSEMSFTVLGYTSEELVGEKYFYDFFIPEEKELLKKKAFEVFSKKENFKNFPNTNIHKNGSEIILETSGSPILNDQNKLVGYRGVDHDISNRKRIENKLQASNERNESFISQVSEGVYRFELDKPMPINLPVEAQIDYLYNHAFIAECNISFMKMYGIKNKKDIIGKSQLQLHGGSTNLKNRKALRGFIESGYRSEGNETEDPNENGEIQYFLNSSIGIVKNGYLLRQWGTQRDITEIKKNELELIKAKDKAEESDRLKSAFLANMSHEIRTPMNGILGFSNLLKEPNLSGKNQKKYIDIIEKSGARMLNIIQEIVDISKIESGEMKVLSKETNINEKVRDVYYLLKLDSEQKRLHLSFINSFAEIDAKINTDGEKLFGILTNLVKNAIKYTDKGLVEFGYNLKGNFLEFYVKDTGVGIPIDRQKAIFERFIQADIIDMEARQGAGLGLSIAKAFVEMLGGKIWVESELGKGATFYFTILYHPIFEAKTVFKNEKELLNEDNLDRGLKILIVDDDETSQFLISQIIEKFAKNILIVSSGLKAVEACKNNTDIDLIFMDIQMPEMNGYEATHQIRQFNKDVVIIAQTAFAMAGDKQKAIEIGCNDYISKPINRTELLSLIKQYTRII